MFVYNDATHDARVWREAATLTSIGWDVTVFALATDGLPATEERPEGHLVRVYVAGTLPGTPGGLTSGGRIGSRARWLAGYLRAVWSWREAAARAAAAQPRTRGPLVLHGHDLTGLIAASAARGLIGGAVVYDSHELFVEAGSAARLPRPAKAGIRAYEDQLARGCAAVITVNESIADELERRHGRRPAVVMNAPILSDPYPTRERSPLRPSLALGDRPVLMHHGGLARGRGIERTIEALRSLPPEVALVLMGDGELVPWIRDLAEGALAGRLYHVPAVPIGDVLTWIAGADIGVIAFEPVDRNNVLGTPNKLFEYLAVGVPVVVSDLPEMGRIVREHRAGVTCNPVDAESIGQAIRQLLNSIRGSSPHDYRDLCIRATSHYSWKHQQDILIQVYSECVYVHDSRSNWKSDL